MKEFLDFLSECQAQYNSCVPCTNNCPNNHYCKANGGQMSKCNLCIFHILWARHPSFTYGCPKITYHYALRFFNRFASEIAYIINSIKPDYFKDKTKLNVVSFGCGPGSEVYGFIQALRMKAPHVVLDYQGYDQNKIWKNVQDISKAKLSQSGHHIEFYSNDMFNDFVGFNGDGVDLLVMNYLLSDVQKFSNNVGQMEQFLSSVGFFVIMNNVRNILFNDSSYYGSKGSMDSGVQLMLRLIEELKKWQVNVNALYRCFPYDAKRGAEQWRSYSKNRLLFPLLPNNNLDKNVRYCNSKQILVHIN